MYYLSPKCDRFLEFVIGFEFSRAQNCIGLKCVRIIFLNSRNSELE